MSNKKKKISITDLERRVAALEKLNKVAPPAKTKGKRGILDIIRMDCKYLGVVADDERECIAVCVFRIIESDGEYFFRAAGSAAVVGYGHTTMDEYTLSPAFTAFSAKISAPACTTANKTDAEVIDEYFCNLVYFIDTNLLHNHSEKWRFVELPDDVAGIRLPDDDGDGTVFPTVDALEADHIHMIAERLLPSPSNDDDL